MKLTKARKILALTYLIAVFALLWITLLDLSFWTYREAKLNDGGEIIVISEECWDPLTFTLAMLCVVCFIFLIIGQAELLKRYGLHKEEK